MTTEAVVLIIHATASALAGLIYALWAYKWAKQRHVLLAVLNTVLAVFAYLFAAWFTFALFELPREVLRPGMRWGVPFILLGPAVVRFLELQAQEHTEAYARAVKRRLGGRDE